VAGQMTKHKRKRHKIYAVSVCESHGDGTTVTVATTATVVMVDGNIAVVRNAFWGGRGIHGGGGDSGGGGGMWGSGGGGDGGGGMWGGGGGSPPMIRNVTTWRYISSYRYKH